MLNRIEPMPSMAEMLLGSAAEHVLEFLHRCLAHADVFVRRRAGNVLRRVGRGEIQAGVGQRRIVVLRILEDTRWPLIFAIAIGGDALVQFVASLQLGATGGAEADRNHGNRKQRHGIFIFGVPKMRKRIHGKQSVPANILYSPERAMKLPTHVPVVLRCTKPLILRLAPVPPNRDVIGKRSPHPTAAPHISSKHRPQPHTLHQQGPGSKQLYYLWAKKTGMHPNRGRAGDRP